MQIADSARFGHCTLEFLLERGCIEFCASCASRPGSLSPGVGFGNLWGQAFLRAFAETPCGDLAAGVGVLEWLPLLGLAGSSLGLGEILAEGVEEGKVCSCISRHVPFGGARAPCLPELLGFARSRGRPGPSERQSAWRKVPGVLTESHLLRTVWGRR